jgi:hypothetical protein
MSFGRHGRRGARGLAAGACLAGATSTLVAGPATAATRLVGPGRTYAKPCDAIVAAQPGDTIQVDAAGSYGGDTCSWSTDNLTLSGVNGRAKIDLTGVTPSGQKGIFTIAAANATIENFELSGAAVSAAAGNNGAGIRFQGTNLTVRNCFLHDNQDGILAAPPTANTGTILIEHTELANNGAGDGFSHNLYIGNFAQFTLRYSYSHGAKVGHLFKSRAYATFVLYSRLTDETGTTASYEVDIPNAGTAYVIGNVIEQSAASQNPTIITFGEEGTPAGYDTHLFVVNNTVLNDLGSGTFVADPTPTPAVITNNVFWNGGTNSSQASAVLTNNFDSTMGDPKLSSVATFDGHLLAGSPCIDKGAAPGQNGSQSLAPAYEYVHPLGDVSRLVVGYAIDIGAYEYGNPVDAGGAVGAESVDATFATGGEAGDDGGGATNPDAPNGSTNTARPSLSGGCGCHVSRAPGNGRFGAGAWGLLLALVGWRRFRAPALKGHVSSERCDAWGRRGLFGFCHGVHAQLFDWRDDGEDRAVEPNGPGRLPCKITETVEGHEGLTL